MELPPTPGAFRLPRPGDQIRHRGNEFRIGDRMGEGFFSTVFECTDLWGNWQVAKVLKPRGTPEDMYERWLGETRRLIELRHPNITYVFDAFFAERVFYIILERCGNSLKDFFGPDADGPKTALVGPVARGVLQALSFVHGHRIVHKDVHLGNVFISQPRNELTGFPGSWWGFKLGDFGIANEEARVRAGTELANWILPPEGLDPATYGPVTPRTDLYHVGLLLFQLATGRLEAFDEAGIRAGKPKERCLNLGTPMAEAIAWGLEADPLLRPASALEYWLKIERALGPDPLSIQYHIR